MSRRDEIAKALAASQAPAPYLKGDARKSTLEQAIDQFTHEHKADRIKPGGMLGYGEALLPEDRKLLKHAIEDMNYQREMGKYGDADSAARRFGTSRETLEALTDRVEVDMVCATLQDRKSDATLPIPAVTRKDVLGAALEMHNATFSEI